jgi:hypothetical protein
MVTRWAWMGFAGLVALAVGVGCQSSDKTLKATDCALGKGGDCGVNPGAGSGVNPGAGGAGGTSGAGGAGGGEEKVVDAKGSVALIDSNTFDHLSDYAKKVTIIAPAPGGSVEGTYAGAGQTFALNGASAGVHWLFARDDSGGNAGIFSTYTAHKVSASTPLVVPVLDQQVLQAIALQQPNFVSFQGLSAQVILELTRQGGPAPGLTLISSAFGGIVAYDQSAGVYSSNGAKKTGGSGVILMINVGIVGGDGELDILLADEVNETYSFSVPVAAGAATVARFDL